MDRNELMFKCDTLRGCVNRIMVTNNQEEQDHMFISAINMLNTIYIENRKRISNIKEREQDGSIIF